MMLVFGLVLILQINLSESDPTIEVLLILDSSMLDFHEEEGVHVYISTAIRGVQRIFRDASIGTRLKVEVKELLLLNQSNANGFYVDRDAERTLVNFCRFEGNYTESRNMRPDVSLLVTRTNLCHRHRASQSIGEVCQTLGLANRGGLCTRGRRCAVAQDTGLVLSHTIAHEVGHLLGLPHDQKDGLTVMSRSTVLLESTKLPSWSAESREQLSMLLHQPSTSCIREENMAANYRTDLNPEIYVDQPGVSYSRDLQCQHKLSSSNTSCCGALHACDRLWCWMEGTCIPTSSPPAPGTICGQHHWCIDGECTPMEARDEAEEGGWGPWSSWSPCSHTCGVGVTKASRNCDSPAPKYGGEYCSGDPVRYEVCTLPPCPSSNSRQDQLQQLCQTRLGSKSAVSLPGQRLCTVFCKTDEGGREIRRIDLEDGSECSVEHTRGVCVHRRCIQIGCDLKLYSTKTDDLCGVCGGDNTTCRAVTGSIQLTQDDLADQTGYRRIFSIPEGGSATIETHGSRENLIALRTQSGLQALNWDLLVKQPGLYSLGNMNVFYVRETFGDWQKERIELSVVRETVNVFVLHRYHMFKISWKYFLPKIKELQMESASIMNFQSDNILWLYSSWSHCSATCGESGIRIRKPVCSKGTDVVPDGNCRLHKRPRVELEHCQLPLCPAYWWAGPWQACESCMEFRQRSVLCISEEMQALPDHKCSSNKRPHFIETCYQLNPCNDKFKLDNSTESFNEKIPEPTKTVTDFYIPLANLAFGQWSNCSAICGDGLKSREVLCLGPGCNGMSKMAQWLGCSNGPCDGWRAGDWTPCSRTCGNGTRVRVVECPGTCAPALKPPHVQGCQEAPCAAWVIGPWASCSANCGTGVKRRLIECKEMFNEEDSIQCSEGDKPKAEEICWEPNCEVFHACQDLLPSYKCSRLGYLCEIQASVTRLCCATCSTRTTDKPRRNKN